MDKNHRETIRTLVRDVLSGRGSVADGLAKVGFEDAAAAESFTTVATRMCLSESAEECFIDLITLTLASPSPSGGIINLSRYVENISDVSVLVSTIASAPPLAQMMAVIFGSSQYMSDILIRQPGYLYWLMEDRSWREMDGADAYAEEIRREAMAFGETETRLNAVRRAQRKMMLRIGVRDLLGQTNVLDTTRELSDLADAVSQVALEIVREEVGCGDKFAVIAMGKLGGRELNYSSDIDLLYVSEDANDEAMSGYLKLARRFTDALSVVSGEGYLYRVDLRLRPDGVAGPMVNGESSLMVYYQNRGRPWEFQAMLKARTIAGARDVGDRVLEAITTLVFTPTLNYSPLEDIARMRIRIRENMPVREREFNIKLMAGGIRDVEFVVQTLQLLHGGRDPQLRTGNTLQALSRLCERKHLKEWACSTLSNAYQFLRVVEHRLQMMHQIKTHNVPESAQEIARLGRRVANGPLTDYEPGQFLETLSKHLTKVRTFSESFFEGEPVHPHAELLMLPEDDERAQAIIAHYGFDNVRRATRVLHSMAYGSFPRLHDRRTRSTFERTLPYLLEELATTGDPDLALGNVAKLAEAGRSESSFFGLLADSPAAREVLVAVAAFSSYLTRRMCNQMDVLDPLLVDPHDTLQRALTDPLPEWEKVDVGGADPSSRHERQHARLDRVALSAFVCDYRRRSLPVEISRGITAAVRRLITSALDTVLGEAENVAVLAMGSFAVGETRLKSDVDLLVVTRGADIPEVTRKIQAINQWFNAGGQLKLDFRLRGEGANAPLVQDLSFYQSYFHDRMSLWEKIAFAKCTLWWGSDSVATTFFDELGASMSRPFDSADTKSLLQMRGKLETLGSKASPDWETKRSRGGRYDIEYLTAMSLAKIATAGGGAYPFSLSTEQRLDLMRAQGVISQRDRDVLIEAMSLFAVVESLMELQETGLPRSREKSAQLDRYLTRTFDRLERPAPEGVLSLLKATKQEVRARFEHIIEQLA